MNKNLNWHQDLNWLQIWTPSLLHIKYQNKDSLKHQADQKEVQELISKSREEGPNVDFEVSTEVLLVVTK